MGQITGSLVNELSRTSILMMSLHGVRTVLERELEIKNLTISTSDSVKRELDRKGQTNYPYGYLSLSELIGIKDQMANRYVQKFGIPAGLRSATRATARKAYMFPINIGLDLKYIDSNVQRTLLMAESMVILSMIGGLQFEVQLSDAIRFTVRIEVPENTAIPVASTSSTESPDASEITLSLVVHTFAGFFRDTPAVNADRPIINMNIIMDGRETITETITETFNEPKTL